MFEILNKILYNKRKRYLPGNVNIDPVSHSINSILKELIDSNLILLNANRREDYKYYREEII